MTEEITASPSAGMPRRSLVKGAAWSLPVIAAAVASPVAAATATTPWDVSIGGGCVLDFAGSGNLFPGFTVSAQCGTTVPDSPLLISETAVGTWTYTLPAPTVLGSTIPADAAIALATPLFATYSLAYATAIVASVAAQAGLSGRGPGVTGPNWLTPLSVADFLTFNTTTTYSGTGADRVAHLAVTFSIARQLQIVGLQPCGQTGWNYLGAIVPPDAKSLPAYDTLVLALGAIPFLGSWVSSGLDTMIGGLSPQLSLTASGLWTDANNGNHAGHSLGNSIVQGGCS
ncbi:hypothetical protein [Microbacterium sp. No. 7]|uniref:hypothetical protein n=1 Tax=Microbacterium sp. No. 7 TaxID=1714373 RepID=UPI0006D017C2|nr:hypothetical protein [Microbacterium sp. No. 7]ALJ19974.1 hypothetical protein AOA12_08650 [Microbacterium sp. No. 7]